MSEDLCGAEAGFTDDNIHLSKAIRTAPKTTSAAVCNPLSVQSCTDPIILELIAGATAANTRRAYEGDLAHFIGWGGTIPSVPDVVATYIAAHAKALAVATLARRVVAIRRVHVLHGLADPTKAELVRLSLRGVRRLHGRPQRQVAPLKIEHLFGFVSGLGTSIRDGRDRALLLIGFAGAFRRSELTAINCACIKYAEQGVEIRLPKSKTDQEAVGRVVTIPHIGGPICPVAALTAWQQMAEITEGALFRRVAKSGKVLRGPLSPGAVATIVKRRVAQIGLDPTNYSGHSLRAGFATCAAAAGLSAWDIKRQTGHVSDAILGRYIREVDQFKYVRTIFDAVPLL